MTLLLPQKRPMKVWRAVVSNHFRFPPFHLTSLSCAGELDPGEVGKAELLAAHFS